MNNLTNNNNNQLCMSNVIRFNKLNQSNLVCCTTTSTSTNMGIADVALIHHPTSDDDVPKKRIRFDSGPQNSSIGGDTDEMVQYTGMMQQVGVENGTASTVGGGIKMREPEPDSIKMFVGQIPRTMDETELKTFFEQYGSVHCLNVLRDKTSGLSRGCCFVTYYTRRDALEAQNVLHNIKTMPGMHHPVQMKPADTENRNDRKLFVGMISKRFAENEVKTLFQPFGLIEDCSVLRDPNGNSKGCAFVTFASRSCALNAIKAMHHSQTMEDCKMPLVVKLADSQKDRDSKKPTSPSPNNNNNGASLMGLPVATGGLGANALTGVSLTGLTNPYLTAATQPQLANLQNAQYMALLQQTLMNSNQPMYAGYGSGIPMGVGGQGAALGGLAAAAVSPSPYAQLAGAYGLTPNGAMQVPVSNGGNQMAVNQQLIALASALQQNNGFNTTPTHQQQQQQTSNMGAIGVQNLIGSYGLNSSTPSSAQCSEVGNNSSGNKSIESLVAAIVQQLKNDKNESSINLNGETTPVISAASSLLSGGGGTISPTQNMISACSSYQPISQSTFANPYAGSALIAGSQPTSVWSSMIPTQPTMTALSLNPYGNTTATFPTTTPAGLDLSQAMSGIQQYYLSAAALSQAQTNGTAGKQTEGPDGANLFIYHLPQEFADTELAGLFSRFGMVLSAKVFIDKQTNLSKCFGFVSYDNAVSAQAAITAMHGYTIGTKRLKVQLKRSKHDKSAPYPISNPSKTQNNNNSTSSTTIILPSTAAS